jgi:hypothetical protein
MLRAGFLSAVLCVVVTAVPAAETVEQARALAIGDTFPRLKAEFLTGRDAVLPDAARGRSALILMGFSYESRFVVEEWVKVFTGEFGGRSDVTYFQVPVIGGMGRLASWFINSGMRKGTPPALHEHVITVYGSVDRWKRVMGYDSSQPNAAYLALIDSAGRVTWLYRGVCDPKAVAGLRTALGSEAK